MNCSCGLRGCHNLTVTTFDTSNNSKTKIHFRNNKNFKGIVFPQDLQRFPLHVATMLIDVDDCYWPYETLPLEIEDGHAPGKQKLLKKDASPTHFMNSELRNPAYKRKILYY